MSTDSGTAQSLTLFRVGGGGEKSGEQKGLHYKFFICNFYKRWN